MSRILPILFNTEMVRAILDGRKTVTRRVIKPQPKMRLCYTFASALKKNIWKWGYPSKTAHEYWGKEFIRPDDLTKEDEEMQWTPPCHTDDILYVRETWCKGKIDCGEEPDGRDALYVSQCTGDESYIHKEYVLRHGVGADDVIWKPSIHMPKEAARIFLKVKDVRVERLQDITEKQAEKEGFIDTAEYCVGNTARGHFRNLWDSTIKKADIDRYGWKTNPWVWVIEFERFEKPEEWK